MENCVFCRIANKEQEAKMLFENSELYVVRDILPKAPVHFLVVTKEHIPSVHQLEARHAKLISDMFLVAKNMANQEGIGERGYKIVFNVGKEGGQTIPHLHMHVLGGKQMSEQ